MTLADLQMIFDRAWSRSFSLKKLAFVFIVLLLCGLLILFFKALALHSGQWISLSLIFLPAFLCSGILLSTGVLLIRIYHDEIKKKKLSYWNIINQSWELILGTAYLSIPIILSYLVLWMLLGVFFLLNETPGVGSVFAVLLAFGPFILNLAALLLCALSLAMLFYMTPIIALRGLNRIQLAETLAKRFQKGIFLNLLLGTIGIFPLLFFMGILLLAAFLTDGLCYACDQPLFLVLHWFFIMIPFTAALTPAVIFFFNFAAESHVLLQKHSR